MRNFALEYVLEGEVTLKNLAQVFPAAAHPLLNALADEVESMTQTLQKRSLQNQQLISRTFDTMQKALQTMRPEEVAKTYSGRFAQALKWTSPKKSAA